MSNGDKMHEAFDAFFNALIAKLIRHGSVDQARFVESQRESWWLVWAASREALCITNPFPALMGDPDALWAREVTEKSLKAQGLKVVG